MKKIEAVIFDWAGTTVDFGSLSPVSAFKEASRMNGIEVTDEETRAPMGMLKIDHIRTMLAMPDVAARWRDAHGREPTEADAQAIYAVFEPALMKVLDRHCDLKPGLLECMRELKRRSVAIGSTTGFTSDMMAVVCAEAAKAGYSPDTFVTADQVGGYGRPYPYMIFENMRRLKIGSVDAVMKVGDTVSDIEEALAAGVTAVSVVEGSSVMGLSRAEWDALSEDERNAHRERTAEVFWRAGAHYVIGRLSALPALVDAVNAARSR